MNTLLTTETISKDEWDATLQAPNGMVDVTMEKPAEHFPFTHRGLCSPFSRNPNPITVLLAEDRPIIREGICSVLELENDIRVIGQASDARQAAELTERLHPEVVVISVAMACRNRMQATRSILHALPVPRVIILARHGNDPYARQVINLGATTCLTEQISAQTLVGTLRKARKGTCGFGRSMSPCLPEKPRSHSAPALSKNPIRPLTSRQEQVLQLIAEGNSNKQTASELSISIKTVEKHREHLMATLGIHETAGLTRYAISAGII
jgi:DNA-binding NarL/FixJ family response regulator